MTTSLSYSSLSTLTSVFTPPNPLLNSRVKFIITRPLKVSCDYSGFEIRDVNYRHPGTQTNILSGINLSLTEKSFGLIYGRSGSGKSTLLQLIAGVTKPTPGSIGIQRFHDNGSPNQSSLLAAPQRVGIVFQFPERYFLADNILEEVTFGWPRQKAGLQLKDDLALRLQRAITSVQSPDLLALDEPLAGLDWKARADVVKLLKNLKERVTILVVSHDLKMGLIYIAESWHHWLTDHGTCIWVECLRKSLYHYKFSSSSCMMLYDCDMR